MGKVSRLPVAETERSLDLGGGGHPTAVAVDRGSQAWTRSLGGEPRRLIDLIVSPALEGSEQLALTFEHHGRETEALTFKKILAGVLARVGALQRAGVSAGDRVMLVLPTGREFVESFFAAQWLGAIPVPTAPPPSLRGSSFGPHRDVLAAIAADCEPRVLLARQPLISALQETLETAATSGLTLIAVSDLEGSDVPEAADDSERPDPALGRGKRDSTGPLSVFSSAPDDTAMLQYTSGSTSLPKGVELSHNNVLANARATTERLFHDRAVVVSWLPLHHDMGLIGSLLTSLYARVPLVLMPPEAFVRDPCRWFQAIHDHRATVTAAPNFAFDYCCEAIDQKRIRDIDLGSLEVVLNGAEPVEPQAVERFEQSFAAFGLSPGVVRPVYGLAESAVAVTFSDAGGLRVDRVDAASLETMGQANPALNGHRFREFVSVGRPIPSQKVRIADQTDKPLDERCVGEVQVKGPSIMKGYFGRRRVSSECLAGGWLHTGDLGYLADGELYITGRIKDLIIRHGRNYYPPDIEAQVAKIEGIRSTGVAVVSIDDAERLQVVVVAETRLRATEALEAVDRTLRTRVHEAFQFGPDQVFLIRRGALPRTTSGKVKRHAVREMVIDGSFERLRAGLPSSLSKASH